MKDIRDVLQKTIDDARPTKGSSGKPVAPQGGGKAARIVSPDDERGTPYPGDFPNPLDGTYHGCF